MDRHSSFLVFFALKCSFLDICGSGTPRCGGSLLRLGWLFSFKHFLSFLGDHLSAWCDILKYHTPIETMSYDIGKYWTPLGEILHDTRKYHTSFGEMSYDTIKVSHAFERSITQTLKVSPSFLRNVAQYFLMLH